MNLFYKYPLRIYYMHHSSGNINLNNSDMTLFPHGDYIIEIRVELHKFQSFMNYI